MVFGSMMALLHGSSIPNTVWQFGKAIDVFIDDNTDKYNIRYVKNSIKYIL